MSYDMIDRFLRNNLDDDNYAEYSAALDELCAPPAQRKPLTDDEIWEIAERSEDGRFSFARAIEAAHGINENKS